MNIKELQTQKAEAEAILQSIKKGKQPLTSKVSEYVKSKFKFAPAGMPSFRPIIGRKYDTSNKGEYNRMLGQIHSDLTDLYDADNYINAELLSTCNYYEAEKTRLTGTLNNLQNEVDNVMTIIEQPRISSDISDSLDDFNRIDFVGNAGRNIPKTDSYIDLRSKCVTNNTEFVNKVSLKGAEISCNILTKNTGNEQLSDIAYCINDNSNETWIQKVTTDTNDKLIYSVGIKVKEEIEVNTVSYIASSPRKQSITLCLVDKDGNRFVHNTITTSEKADWNFKSKKIVAILFEVEKQECDATNGVAYDYYIGAKNISLYNNIYLEKSVFVSEGAPIDKPFSQVVFCAKESVPASTNISYYIGVDNGKNNVSWMQADNNVVTELNLLPKKLISFEEPVATNIVCELNEIPVPKSSKLFVGVDMWQVREASIDSQVKNIFSNPIKTFEEMDSIRYEINAKTSAVYTAYADFDSPKVISATFGGDELDHSIYINGAKITGRDSDDGILYSIRMAKGTNKIQILVTNKLSTKRSFKFDVYLQEFATMVRAIDESKEVDVYNINYATHEDAFEKYTIIGSNVVVNYDTTTYPIRYAMEYRYVDNPELFEDAKLRIMAVLVSRNPDVAPKIYAYQAAIL